MGFRTRRLLCALVAVPVIASPVLAGCSWFGGGNDNGNKSISVFNVKPGQCFVAQSKVKAELSNLTSVPCTKAHTQEAYAVVQYTGTGAAGPSASASPSADAYPGGALLEKYAKGVCAQRFTAYVGIDYLDSTLFYTYLLPSPRSWEQNDDRSVLCFITTTGGTLKTSVKGSKK